MIALAPFPLLYFTGSLLTSLVAFQSEQSIRKPLLALFLTSTWLAFCNILVIFPNPDHASCCGIFILIWCSHIVHATLIEKYTITLPHSSSSTNRFPTEKINGISSVRNWIAKYKILYNLRWVKTRNAAPGIPAPHHHNSRIKFVTARLGSVLAIYTFTHYYNLVLTTAPVSAHDFLPDREHALRRLSEITLRECIIRTFFVFHFIWGSYAEFEIVHQLYASISVSIGIDDPEDWPPLYGSIKDTFTLRHFWGRFWHRLVYRSYGAYGRLLSHEVLRVKKGSAMDRFVRNGTVFFLSGCAHAAVTWRLGFTCGYWEDISWFTGNFLAMYAEEAFFALVTGWLGEDVWKRPAIKTWGRAMGYLWVAAWLWWSLPKTMYPKMRCMPIQVPPDFIEPVVRPELVAKWRSLVCGSHLLFLYISIVH